MFWRGAASNTQVDSGASLVVSSGGVASHTVISGGIMELTIGGFADDAITFTGAAGTLQIDDTTMPDSTISGFEPGDTFDLAGVAFDPSGSADLLSGNVLES